MSSSQQPSTNSNHNQPENTNPHPQAPANIPLDDYVDDPSLYSDFQNLAFYTQGPDVVSDSVYYSTQTIYYNADLDEALPSDLVAELNAREEHLINEPFEDNEENETEYPDGVDTAYENYENEYSKYWQQNNPTWDYFSNDEQEETLNQMQQCMLFMSDEYATAEMPYNLIESSQESRLNPDAVEFQPPWSVSAPSTDKEPIVVTSWQPCQAKKQDDD